MGSAKAKVGVITGNLMEQSSEKTEKGTIPGVAIDGARIRSIREAKKLTQLYVASVVGVTTDTISRWENNRYPSIRRDNAEKLAGALEVDMDEILRKEEPDVAPPPPASPPARRQRTLFLVVSCFSVLILLLLALYLFLHRPVPAPSAVRWLPHFAAPGAIVPVEIRITAAQGESGGFIVRERLPEGVKLVGSIPPLSASGTSAPTVKWFIPGGKRSVTIYYTMQVPATVSPGTGLKVSGEVVVHSGGANLVEAISGSDRIRIGAYHWADSNGDGRIDDDEIMPAYYVCEDMKGLALDWKTIEDIWSGKGYRWDTQHGFTVMK